MILFTYPTAYEQGLIAALSFLGFVLLFALAAVLTHFSARNDAHVHYHDGRDDHRHYRYEKPVCQHCGSLYEPRQAEKLSHCELRRRR